MIERILVQNVHKRFKIGFKKHQSTLARIVSFISGRESKKTLTAVNLDNISFTVTGGEVLGIIGPNGSGKSTLLRIIANIYPDYEGKVVTHGKVVSLISLNI